VAGDLLIQHALVWPAADQPPLADAAVLVRDGRIARVGRFHAHAEQVLDADGCLLMPGLIQAHVHLAQTLFRGLAEDLPLLPWLSQWIWPLEAAHDEASLLASARLACAELVRGGVTAFLSMETVRHTHAVFAAAEESGLMGVVGHCFMDAAGGYAPLAVPLDDALADCDVLLDKLGAHDRLRLAVAPRFALSSSERNLRAIAAYARQRGLRIHTHAAEQTAEVRLVRERTGRGNVAWLHALGLTGPDVALAHAVHLEPDEVDLLAATGTSVLHCPTANLKLGSGLAPVPEYLARGINVALGSDGAACNNRLDLFAEMRQAGLIQALRRGPGALPARALVGMATAGGARALGWAGEMGTLAAGRRANLVLLNPRRLSVAPGADPAANVVYAHEPADVEVTMVNGEILYRNGRFTRVDEAAIIADARKQRQKLLRRAGLAGAGG